MAVNIPNRFSLRIGSTGEDPSRVATVAWLIAAHEDSSLVDLNPNAHDLQKALKEFVNKNPETGVFINDSMPKKLVPQEHINWIKDNQRQFFWIRDYISKLKTSQPKKNKERPVSSNSHTTHIYTSPSIKSGEERCIRRLLVD
ncbi:hypothetical protein [Acidovorax sp. MR-S7]|uniref:hypothetical protein n=1 Tax=Acidovorax sp. MR-S7 TaxID=1268622 RepID=UPI0003D3F255|nr:hypothetical protein [Acidovorax sp. MR-S7]GAD21996.1 hypothetical protein AVS7_01756 [Acidovorax sp. MR-S7]